MESYGLTAISSNRKVGPIPVSTSSKDTCPNVCPLKDAGCYGDGGPVNLHWNAVTKGERGTDFDTFTNKVKAMPKHQLWRHNQVGDLPGDGDDLDRGKLARLVKANKGKRGFTFTHKPVTPENVAAVRQANYDGFTINWSANNLAHADKLVALYAGPVATVLPATLERHSVKKVWTESMTDYRARIKGLATPNGTKITVCPATYQDDMNCMRCGLCAKAKRTAVVGFPAHGMRKAKASAIAQQ